MIVRGKRRNFSKSEVTSSTAFVVPFLHCNKTYGRSSTTNLLEDAETSDAQNELEKMMREIKKTASKLGPFATSSYPS